MEKQQQQRGIDEKRTKDFLARFVSKNDSNESPDFIKSFNGQDNERDERTLLYITQTEVDTFIRENEDDIQNLQNEFFPNHECSIKNIIEVNAHFINLSQEELRNQMKKVKEKKEQNERMSISPSPVHILSQENKEMVNSIVPFDAKNTAQIVLQNKKDIPQNIILKYSVSPQNMIQFSQKNSLNLDQLQESLEINKKYNCRMKTISSLLEKDCSLEDVRAIMDFYNEINFKLSDESKRLITATINGQLSYEALCEFYQFSVHKSISLMVNEIQDIEKRDRRPMYSSSLRKSLIISQELGLPYRDYIEHLEHLEYQDELDEDEIYS